MISAYIWGQEISLLYNQSLSCFCLAIHECQTWCHTSCTVTVNVLECPNPVETQR